MLACVNCTAVGQNTEICARRARDPEAHCIVRSFHHRLTGAAPQVSRKPLFACMGPVGGPQRELLIEPFTPIFTKGPIR
jgi:hypothetical protein